MLKLLSSTNLCKALKYNESNFLDMPDLDDPSELTYQYIFPFNRIPDTLSEAKTFITFSFRDYKAIDSYFKSGLIHINILVHKENMTTDIGMLRIDFILSEIDALMDRGIGIGKMELYKYDEFNVNADYLGAYVSYKITDFR